jgi:hypothetical protein
MRDELLKKLEATLAEGIRAERDVVYLLVEVRKLMDREDYEDSVIKSFTNWAVHSELEQKGEGTTDLLREFDEVVRLRKEENKGSLCPPHCSFETFRRNLGALLSIYQLSSEVVDNERAWMAFARLYSAVVSDCPIKFTASKDALRYVREVELKKPGELNPGPHLEFLEWQVTLMNGEVEHIPILLM